MLRCVILLGVMLFPQVAAEAAEKPKTPAEFLQQHSCEPTIKGLSDALNRYKLFNVGFERKRKLRQFSITLDDINAKSIERSDYDRLEDIAKHLKRLNSLALIYDIGTSDSAQEFKLCSWMLENADNSNQGPVLNIIAASVEFKLAEVKSRSLSALATRALDVDRRAALRAPKPKWSADQVEKSDANPGTISLDAISSFLLPSKISDALTKSNKQRILILPTGDLSTVPFAALKLSDFDLIDRFAIVILSDVDGLQAKNDEPAIQPFRGDKLIVGDPDLSWDKDDKGEPRWIKLPGARAEAISIASLAGAEPILGAAANKKTVTNRLAADRKHLSLIYFATHGVADGVNPMDGSFLALNGDHLLAENIKKYQFGTARPLVVMSACQTGLGKVFDGGVFGLARAWIFAGAPQVVMSLWNINDDATKALMVSFMRRVQSGEKVEFALQAAMKELKAQEKYADPALWSAFAVFGRASAYD